MRVPLGLGPDAPTLDVNVADAPQRSCVAQRRHASAGCRGSGRKQSASRQQEDEEANTEEASHGDENQTRGSAVEAVHLRCPPFATAELNVAFSASFGAFRPIMRRRS